MVSRQTNSDSRHIKGDLSEAGKTNAGTPNDDAAAAVAADDRASLSGAQDCVGAV